MSDADDQAEPGLATVTRVAGSVRPRAAAVPARLRAVWPPGLGSWSLSLGTEGQVVGRIAGPQCREPLVHETVSRRHLRVEWDGRHGHHVVSDLGSHNGSRIDGVELGDARCPLPDGAVVQLGDVCLVHERGASLGQDTRQAGAAVANDAVPGQSPAILGLRAGIGRAARDPSPVLLLGETGTGKEWIARELHRLSGRAGAWVAINCSALSPQIIDSQLFGHVKGAFTGATADQPGVFRAADGGTLFLDEIGDLPLELQPKLLRALQEGEVQPVGSTRPTRVDVRVVAATNQALVARVRDGAFRRDLYARLALWELQIPPLRERRGDLFGWIDRMHAAWCERRPHVPATAIAWSPEAAEALLRYGWPSNLREVDRLVHEIGAADLRGPVALTQLPPWIAMPPTADAPAPSPDEADTGEKRAVPTREEFVAVFEQLDGNVRAMAKHFDRDRRQIYRWIEAHGLADRRSRSPQ